MARNYNMMMVVRGNTRDAQRAMSQLSNATSRMGSSVKRYAGMAGTAIAAAIGVGLVVAVRAGTKELMEMQQMNAQTAAGIKSTGGIANVTAKHITELSNAMLKKTGIDDQATQAAANMLLTFTKIRNESGSGVKTFDKATLAVANMAATLANGAIPTTEQMSTSAIRLGKALNDPVKGVTALKKVGVDLTAQQKKQIEQFMKHGQIVKAQGVILKELNTQMGGRAAAAGATLAGQMARLREQFNGASASATGKVIPSLLRLVGGFQKAVGVGGSLRPIIGGLKDLWAALGIAMNRSVASFSAAFGGSARTKQGMRDLAAAVGAGITKIGLLTITWLPKLAAALGYVAGFYDRHRLALKLMAAALLGPIGAMLIFKKQILVGGSAVAAFVAMVLRADAALIDLVRTGIVNVLRGVGKLGGVLAAINPKFKGLGEAASTAADVLDKQMAGAARRVRKAADEVDHLSTRLDAMARPRTITFTLKMVGGRTVGRQPSYPGQSAGGGGGGTRGSFMGMSMGGSIDATGTIGGDPNTNQFLQYARNAGNPTAGFLASRIGVNTRRLAGAVATRTKLSGEVADLKRRIRPLAKDLARKNKAILVLQKRYLNAGKKQKPGIAKQKAKVVLEIRSLKAKLAPLNDALANLTGRYDAAASDALAAAADIAGDEGTLADERASDEYAAEDLRREALGLNSQADDAHTAALNRIRAANGLPPLGGGTGGGDGTDSASGGTAAPLQQHFYFTHIPDQMVVSRQAAWAARTSGLVVR